MSMYTVKENFSIGPKNRRVSIEVWDDSEGLPIENRLVIHGTDMVTEHSDEQVIRSFIFNNTEQIRETIINHNILRSTTADSDLYQRTGVRDYLGPITISDLRWTVK